MPRPSRPLDIPPTTLRDAVGDLAKIANICLKAGLPNAGTRCAVIADWLAKVKIQTVDLEALDAEWAVGSTRVVPPTAEGHSPRSIVIHPPLVPKPAAADVHLNTDTEGLTLVKDSLAHGGPQRTSDLAKLLGIRRPMAKQKLKRWRAAGHLTTIGKSAGSRWALPDKPFASPADAIASARDAAVLAEVQKCKTYGVDQQALAKVLPAEPGAATLPTTRLQGVLRRLSFKNLIEFRDGRYYPAA